MKKIQSAYQKMYLVTPGVYQKLLNCIEDKDKMSTEQLNIPKVPPEIKTPSEAMVEEISNRDIGIQTIPPQTENIEMQFPETGEMGTQTINPPQTGEIGVQVGPETGEMATETDPIPAQPMYTQTDRIIGPIETPIQFPIQPQNPLREPCPQDTNEGGIIPSLFYKPSIRNRRPMKTLGKITKPQLQAALQNIHQTLLPRQIVYQQPQRTLAIEHFPEPILEQQTISKPRDLRQNILSVAGPSGFSCHICGHKYTRKHDLKRHLQSKTAHKNLQRNLQPPQPLGKILLPPHPSYVPDLPDEEFEFWDNDPQPPVAPLNHNPYL